MSTYSVYHGKVVCDKGSDKPQAGDVIWLFNGNSADMTERSNKYRDSQWQTAQQWAATHGLKIGSRAWMRGDYPNCTAYRLAGASYPA